MGKALTGAVLLGVDAALIGGAAFSFGATAFVDALMHTALGAAMVAIGGAGLSLEAGAIAGALASPPGMAITTRQAASYRQIIYGVQRVGGVIVYRSTTGSHKDQYNMVIVIADHPVNAIVNLFLDGRQVYWKGGSDPGFTVRNGIGFGGNADGNDHKDQGGNTYNFGGLVYCEARFGTQLPGDVMAGLTDNDPTWKASGGQSPYLGGMTYVYLKVESDAKMFPSFPEIRFTVQGKNDIWDPRTNTRGFTDNWALCVNDVLTETEFGIGEAQANVNTAQLIAAANVCDQQIALAAGNTERQWTCNATFSTGNSPGEILGTMMPAAQGRLSYVGGEWFIWPSYWQGPTFNFDQTHLLEDISGMQTGNKVRERYNRVKGTYIAPNFPYTIYGNLYDGKGFYDGTRQDNFNFEWLRTDAPYYAQDAEHGYAGDQWLTADNGYERWLDIQHQCVISVATCQRTFKVALLRNRICGNKMTLVMGMEAYQLVPMDVIQFSYAPWGWTNKLFEVVSSQLQFQPVEDGSGMTGRVILQVQATDPSIYTWSTREELNIYEQPAGSTNYAYTVQPPTNVTVTDVSLNLVKSPDGVVHPRALCTWTPAADANVTAVDVQYSASTAKTWTSVGRFANSSGFCEFPVTPNTSYLVMVQAVTANGADSTPVIVNYTSGAFTSNVNSGGLGGGLNPNAPNNATVDSVLSGSTATVRVYGPGGVGTSITQNLGSLALVLPAATIAGQPLSTLIQVYWNIPGNSYVVNPPPNDEYVFVGSCTTIGSGGTGGSSGGGGYSPGGGGIGCTIRGTQLISDRGQESNIAIYERFVSGEPTYLMGRDVPERIISAEWVHEDHYQLIEVDGFRSFGCSDSHTMLPEGSDRHIWCSLIESGTKVDTIDGFSTMKRTGVIDAPTEVLKIELEGPSHEYLVEDGIWAHNIKPLNPPGQ